MTCTSLRIDFFFLFFFPYSPLSPSLLGLIHDLGKLLYFYGAEGQWDVVGGIYVSLVNLNFIIMKEMKSYCNLVKKTLPFLY